MNMRASNAADFRCGLWGPYQATQAWYVAPGTTQVYLQLMDAAGNSTARLPAGRILIEWT